jgi:hypothetical protein
MTPTHSPENSLDPLLELVGVIGSSIAGRIAHILLRDGFKRVEVLTLDRSVGGVWCEERVYPGLQINKFVFLRRVLSPVFNVEPSVHGEFRFSAMPMREPNGPVKIGGRLSGEDV